MKLEFAMKLEFQKLVLFEKIYFKFAETFFMVLEFMKLEYHRKLNFNKLEYPKSGRSLHIFETVLNYNIVCKNVLLDYFCH